MASNYLEDATRIVDDRWHQLDRREDERTEMIVLRDRLADLHKRSAEGDWALIATAVEMLSWSIMERCPHDPSGYAIDDGDQPSSRKVRCLHCNAYKFDSSHTT